MWSSSSHEKGILGSEASEGMGQRLLENAVSWWGTPKGWGDKKNSRALGASSHSDRDVAKLGSGERDLCGSRLCCQGLAAPEPQAAGLPLPSWGPDKDLLPLDEKVTCFIDCIAIFAE